MSTQAASVLAEIEHAMNETDVMNERLGLPGVPHGERVLAAVASCAQIIADTHRYGSPLETHLRGAIAEFTRLLEHDRREA